MVINDNENLIKLLAPTSLADAQVDNEFKIEDQGKTITKTLDQSQSNNEALKTNNFKAKPYVAKAYDAKEPMLRFISTMHTIKAKVKINKYKTVE